jgi:hypothetical protein
MAGGIKTGVLDTLKTVSTVTQQTEKHSSLQDADLTTAQKRNLLQHMAAINPDAALAYAQYLNNDQAQQAIQAEAPGAQV